MMPQDQGNQSPPSPPTHPAQLQLAVSLQALGHLSLFITVSQWDVSLPGLLDSLCNEEGSALL